MDLIDKLTQYWGGLIRCFESEFLHPRESDKPDNNERITFDKETFQPFYVVDYLENELEIKGTNERYKFLVKNLDTDESCMYDIITLDTKFFTHDNYNKYYHEHVDKVNTIPYVMWCKNGHKSDGISFVQQISEDEYLYVMHYYNEGTDSQEKHIIRMNMEEILECDKDPDAYMNRMRNMKEHMKPPIGYYYLKGQGKVI
jgi:hypothetical protein